ncbi:MAG: hypothetical protein OHK006_04000 [Thermodesulfovibrionales bacterium]
MKRLVVRIRLDAMASRGLDEALALRTGLQLDHVRDAIGKGALWSVRGRRRERIRETQPGKAGADTVELCYDEELLALVPPSAACIDDQRSYSVWIKPPGLLSQGTRFGDHCSLIRQAELHFNPARKVFLVHRLDREVEGIMLLAHTKPAAAKLSFLFRENRIRKTYRAQVLGMLGDEGTSGTISADLDGKPARTDYRIEACSPDAATSLVSVTIETGRLHQIRRHFEMIGHPVMGDPTYGAGNKNRQGIRLQAVGLEFVCPFRKKLVAYELPEAKKA